jgi:aerobic-type carbon monoxide dehydrogenase small subunit (CoxS/CutS family)
VDSGTHAADKSMKQRQAFWDENAFQCGYCLSGMLFAAQDLLERNPDATEGEIRAAIAGNLCRCTGSYDNGDSLPRQQPARHSARIGVPHGD